MIDETEENFSQIFTKFLEIVNQHAPLVIFTNDNYTIANAYTKILQPLNTKYHLYQWYLIKNVMKILSAKLDNNWILFIKDFYKCLEKIDISEFFSQQDILKISYLSASTYLLRMEKIKEKQVACYNHNIFIIDMTTT